MSADMIPLISKALLETVYMVAVSMMISTIIGIRPFHTICYLNGSNYPVDPPDCRQLHWYNCCHGTTYFSISTIYQPPGRNLPA